ncbi:C1 family peptidase [Rhizobium leguminosarum]|uniref:C1 family peptidase n=1 Tax=Rhizobium leguminosarum TaxID=384 RepID=UPI001C943742|nr:C1 family peptidase [Rhizobium leguminosarum]MBY5524056.1 C1 family peptidase [Rhizobium leguminosarum]
MLSGFQKAFGSVVGGPNRLQTLGTVPYLAPMNGGCLPSADVFAFASRGVRSKITLPPQFKIDSIPGTGSDQGQRGTCTAFAASTCMEKKSGVDLSEQDLYFEGIKRRGTPATVDGLSPQEAFLVLRDTGVPSEDAWPYVPTLDRNNIGGGPPPPGLPAAQKFFAPGMRSITAAPDRTFDAVCRQIFKSKHPILMVTPVQPEAGWPSGPIVDDGPNVQPSLPSHCVAICGFNLSTSSLIFRNSWGISWGIFGFGIMRKPYFDKYVNELWEIP